MQILPSDLLAPVETGRAGGVPNDGTDIFADILIAAFEARLTTEGDDEPQALPAPRADDEPAAVDFDDAAPRETETDDEPVEAAASDDTDAEATDGEASTTEAAATEAAPQVAQAKLGPDANILATGAQSDMQLAVETFGAAGTTAATTAKLSDTATAATPNAGQAGIVQTSAAAPTQQTGGAALPGAQQAAATTQNANTAQAGPQTAANVAATDGDVVAETVLRPLQQAATTTQTASATQRDPAAQATQTAQNGGPETNVIAGRTIKVTEAPAEVQSRPSANLTPNAAELTASLRGDRPELAALNAPGATAMAARPNGNAATAAATSQPAPDLTPTPNPAAMAPTPAPAASALAAASRGAVATPVAADGGTPAPTAPSTTANADPLTATQPQATRGATASQTAATAKPFAQHLPPPPPEQLALHIQRAFRSGVDRLQLQMRPPELGQVDVELEMAQGGKVKAVVVVEKPETLDLLQRDARSLERALQQAGLDADGSSLEFNLRGEGSDGNGQQQAHGQNAGEAVFLDDADEAEADVADATPVDIIEDDRVDVRV